MRSIASLYFFFENRAVYELMCEKYCRAGQATDGNIIRRMHFACRIPKATNKHSVYVWLGEFSQKNTTIKC